MTPWPSVPGNQLRILTPSLTSCIIWAGVSSAVSDNNNTVFGVLMKTRDNLYE
jgi:hypothetical protein